MSGTSDLLLYDGNQSPGTALHSQYQQHEQSYLRYSSTFNSWLGSRLFCI